MLEHEIQRREVNRRPNDLYDLDFTGMRRTVRTGISLRKYRRMSSPIWTVLPCSRSTSWIRVYLSLP